MKKQFGIAMIALSAAMAFTFTACNDDSSSAKGPEKVSKVEDLSAECEDGEEALVGDKETLYTCTDGKWATEAKSSASKPKSSSSKVEEEEDECDPDLENCDDDNGENNEEEVKSSSSKKPSGGKGDSGSGSGSGEGGSGSEEEGGETEIPCTEDTETKACIDGKLVDNENVGYCCTKAGKCTLENQYKKYDKTTHFCFRMDTEPLCNGKTYAPATGGECGEDGNYYHSTTEGSFFEDLRNNKTYKYININDVIWMAENLNYTEGLTENKNYYTSTTYDGIAYTWAAAMGSTEEECGYGHDCPLEEGVQGICPNGWHLPTKAEWKNLFDKVTIEALLSASWKDKNSRFAGVTGESGFEAIPAYSIYDDGKMDMPIFWSSTEYDNNNANMAELFIYGGDLIYTEIIGDQKDAANNVSGFAAQVRCIKNDVK